MPEIELNPATLPSHEQRVKWQSLLEDGTDQWKEGEYLKDSQMFLMPNNDFDNAWHVVRWEPST